MSPPKPASRPEKVRFWQYLRLFRKDILSAQPARLYRAWMAEYRTPFFRSVLINQPDLIEEVLKGRPSDFPKSDRVGQGLRPLLGNSVFLTNGETWRRQRRIIDPAFERGRLRDVVASIIAAGREAVARLGKHSGTLEIEEMTSRLAADVIFRTLFSIPITDRIAAEVFHEFRTYQRSQPILNLAAFLPIFRWWPIFHRRETRKSAVKIRTLLAALTRDRMALIQAGNAPDDLATKIMTTPDPETCKCFEIGEMVDQVAIFFLAGHETSASALAWALYLLADHPEVQLRLVEEAATLPDDPDLGDISKLTFTRNVFRETLRLYPPVPMMVRQTQGPERFRDRELKVGTQVVISPWHLHRHERLWDQPDAFDPDRYETENGKTCLRRAYLPFSAGERVCPGAGFAMIEGPLLLAQMIRNFEFKTVAGRVPVPVAHLTVRARDGIWLDVAARNPRG
jgi:cytochrome P450